MHRHLTRVLIYALLTASTSAVAITIDANLADWGIQRTGRASDWSPLPGIVHVAEDQHNSYLNPGYGAQAYDAEALYLTRDNDYLYIALVTGHSPLTPNRPSANSWGAGDIAIDLGADGSWDLGIETTGNQGTQGGIYSGVGWAYGIWDAQGRYDPAHPDRTHPTSILGGRLEATAALAYTTSGQAGYGLWTGDKHYFYEVAVPWSVFGSQWAGSLFDVHWTMNCANDSIQLRDTLPVPALRQTQGLPEPGSLALLPLGLVALAALRVRRSG